jgi:hypothetical protein
VIDHQGDIPEPRAFRGEIPKPRSHVGAKQVEFPWKGHREIAMALPPARGPGGELRGGWVLCGEARRRGDGPKIRRRLIWNMQKRLARFLDLRYPLERYQLAVVAAEGTDCDMQLWMRYLGELTPEEDRLDRKRKRENYEAMMQHRREVKAARELENRRRGAAQG